MRVATLTNFYPEDDASNSLELESFLFRAAGIRITSPAGKAAVVEVDTVDTATQPRQRLYPDEQEEFEDEKQAMPDLWEEGVKSLVLVGQKPGLQPPPTLCKLEELFFPSRMRLRQEMRRYKARCLEKMVQLVASACPSTFTRSR